MTASTTIGDTFTGAAETPDIVNALATSPGFARDGVCFAARNSGLYRSDDGGRSWRTLYDSLALTETLATTAVALSPDWESDHTLWAGVNGGVLRSTDGGATWQATLLPAPPPLITALAVSPNYLEDGVVFAASIEDGVFRSADRGSSWSTWNFGLLDLGVLCLAVSPGFADDATLYAGTETGLFRSTNGGLAWREAEFSPDLAPVLSAALSPDGGVLFVGTEASGLWRSDDRGRSWARLGEHVLSGSINGVVAGGRSGAAESVLALAQDRLLVSRDGGATWTDWQTGLRWEAGAASVAAPVGLDAGSPLLVGLFEGGVARL